MADSNEHQVALLTGLDPGGMIQAEAGGEPVLLVRDGDHVTALGALCPHAGAPLVDGVRHNGQVICPWHKAAFCLRTGRMLQPPALDDLPRFATRVQDGKVFVRVPAMEPEPAEQTQKDRHVVIVGAGAAGATAAQTLRQAGFGGRITMLDRENRVPYDRTILSKYALSGEKGAEKSPLQPQDFYRRHRIDRLTAAVTRLNPDAREIVCADGQIFHYDAALVATGAEPVKPKFPGAGLDNVFTLRSRADADGILAQAERSTCAVVLGASFIGMEVAASLRERGLDVVVVGQEKVPFEKQLGAQIGGAFVTLHEKHGVEFRLGRQVAALEGDGAVRHVVLDNGERLPADLVVAGFGVAPATGFVQGVTRNHDGGITVDGHLRAADGLYAAGDIAHYPPAPAAAPIRVEHWRVAEQHGRAVALHIMGHGAPFDAVPVFWTIHYMKRLDYIGHATDWDDIVLHGDLGKPEFLAYYIKHGHVVAAAGMDRDLDTAALIALFDLRKDWTARELTGRPAAVLAALQSG